MADADEVSGDASGSRCHVHGRHISGRLSQLTLDAVALAVRAPDASSGRGSKDAFHAGMHDMVALRRASGQEEWMYSERECVWQ